MSSDGRSRVTSQGQVSVPSEVRRALGLCAGAVLEWTIERDTVVVRRAGRFTSADVHDELFPEPPTPRSLEELRGGIGRHMRARHARR